jgi:4'-phosphopantetheinyl transferase
MSDGFSTADGQERREPHPIPSLTAPTVWVVPLDRFEPEKLAGFCAAEDFVRQERLRFPHLRRRALVRWAALRHLLGKATGQTPSSLSFERDRWGKPFLQQPRSQRGLHFNASHSQERAAIILADLPVGIDLEHTGPERHWREMTDLVCTAAELALVESLSQEAQVRAFYRLWVAKESLVKADGRGLSLPVNRIDASALAREPAIARVWMPATSAFFHARGFDLETDYVASLAAEAPLGVPKILSWEPD